MIRSGCPQTNQICVEATNEVLNVLKNSISIFNGKEKLRYSIEKDGALP